MNATIPDAVAESSAPTSRQNVVLAICCLSLLVVSMDATIVNVALPDIRRDLGASITGLQWVIDAYTIVIASFLMLGGSTADRFGRRRVFQVGMALFTLGSLLCSLAAGIGSLVTARVIQALGGSMMNPVAMSIIVHTFVEPKGRARAIGIWAAVAWRTDGSDGQTSQAVKSRVKHYCFRRTVPQVPGSSPGRGANPVQKWSLPHDRPAAATGPVRAGCPGVASDALRTRSCRLPSCGRRPLSTAS